jgi:hypothetical protein
MQKRCISTFIITLATAAGTIILASTGQAGWSANFPSVNPMAADPLRDIQLPPRMLCRLHAAPNGFPLPDPRCSPGAINPTVTLDILKFGHFRTGTVRNHLSSEAEKHIVYGWYGIREPRGNYGPNQVCELDHIVPLELGGADSLANIWPQCGRFAYGKSGTFFHQKDIVENYLAYAVKHGKIPLQSAQIGIATNWTQYLEIASQTCPDGRCPGSKWMRKQHSDYSYRRKFWHFHHFRW